MIYNVLVRKQLKMSGPKAYFKTKIQRISEEISQITSRLDNELFMAPETKKRLLERIFSLKKMRENIRKVFGVDRDRRDT